MFTSSEYFDMLVLYGQCDKSTTVAAEEYAVCFPNREHPSRSTITRKILRGHHKCLSQLVGVAAHLKHSAQPPTMGQSFIMTRARILGN
jgi:hypothetical protein